MAMAFEARGSSLQRTKRADGMGARQDARAHRAFFFPMPLGERHPPEWVASIRRDFRLPFAAGISPIDARRFADCAPDRDGRRLGRKTMSTCTLTHREFPNEELTPLSAIRPRLAQLIRSRHPELAEGSLVSLEALGTFRAEYVRNVLEEDIGAITALEHEVVRSMQEHELLASNVEQTFATKLSFGERLSDRIADIGGSWRFIIGFGVFLGLWILANILLFSTHPPDPYPFILLNLILSCLAALQAPVIMMSQNRQEAKDRLRAEHDYKVNLKAELEIRHLHEKVDYLLKQQRSGSSNCRTFKLS
jgi:uncharacterized membrane protein